MFTSMPTSMLPSEEPSKRILACDRSSSFQWRGVRELISRKERCRDLNDSSSLRKTSQRVEFVNAANWYA